MRQMLLLSKLLELKRLSSGLESPEFPYVKYTVKKANKHVFSSCGFDTTLLFGTIFDRHH